MTIEYVWSPSTAGFYPIAEKERLTAAGTWPDDGVGLTGEEYSALFPAPPGKYIDSLNGRPQWVDSKRRLSTVWQILIFLRG